MTNSVYPESQSHFPCSLQEKLKETLADLEATNPKLGVFRHFSEMGAPAFRLRSYRFVGPRYVNCICVYLYIIYHNVLAIIL